VYRTIKSEPPENRQIELRLQSLSEDACSGRGEYAAEYKLAKGAIHVENVRLELAAWMKTWEGWNWLEIVY
jgi:hypothetical protein